MLGFHLISEGGVQRNGLNFNVSPWRKFRLIVILFVDCSLGIYRARLRFDLLKMRLRCMHRLLSRSEADLVEKELALYSSRSPS